MSDEVFTGRPTFAGPLAMPSHAGIQFSDGSGVGIRTTCTVAEAAERFGWTPIDILEHVAAMIRDLVPSTPYSRLACDSAEAAASYLRSERPKIKET